MSSQGQGGGRSRRSRVAGSIVGVGAVLTVSLLGSYGGRVQRAYATSTSCGVVTDSSSLDTAITAFNNASNPCDQLFLGSNVTLTRSPLAVSSSTKSLTIDGNGYAIDGQDLYRPFEIALAASDSIHVSDLTIHDGLAPTAAPSKGGAILVTGGHLYVDESVFHDNTATRGGAINSNAPVTITRSVFDNNNAASDGNNNGRGGAIYTNGSSLAVTDSSFTSNFTSGTPGGYGGAVSAQNTDISVSGSTIAGNSSGWQGGAIRLRNGDLSFLNSTVTGNSSHWGGAVYAVLTNAHSVSLDFTTVTGNAAQQGSGGLDLYSRPAMAVPVRNSILNDNLLTSGPNPDAYGNPFVSYYGQSKGPVTFALSYSAYTSAGSISQVNSAVGAVVSASPLVGPLADNGGFTLPDGSRITTMNPLVDSPGLSAANPNASGFPSTDQRGAGFPRIPAQGPADIGAIQRSSPPQPTPPNPAAPSVATPPRDVTAVAGNGSASVSWSVPSSSGSFPVSHYSAISTPGAHTCLAAAPARTCDVSGLTNGTSYTFTVKALTGAGWSTASEASNVVVPRASAGPSIVIRGARDGKRIEVTGSTTGFGMGAILNPWVRLAGQSGYSQGFAQVLVSMNGAFEWGRTTGKKVSVYMQTPDGSVRSNMVTIRAS